MHDAYGKARLSILGYSPSGASGTRILSGASSIFASLFGYRDVPFASTQRLNALPQEINVPTNLHSIDRRQFLAAGVTGAAVAALSATPARAEQASSLIRGQAEHVISIWLGGGMGQIDTFDPKVKGDPKSKKPGSYYDAIPTAVAGVQVCEHLPKMAAIMDRVTAVRTVNHSVIDEHAAATKWMYVGRPVSCTVV